MQSLISTQRIACLTSSRLLTPSTAGQLLCASTVSPTELVINLSFHHTSHLSRMLLDVRMTKRHTTTRPIQDLRQQQIIFAKQSSCLCCSRPRSTRAQHALRDSAPHNLGCSRRSCAEVKLLLRKASDAKAAVVVEIHHHYHTDYAAGTTYVPVRASELCAEPSQGSWAELPGEAVPCHFTSQSYGTLPTIFEEPQYVDTSKKPSAKAVREALGWSVS
jgi:hypothetical protein